MPIHKTQRKLRANKPKLICSVLHCAVWEIIVIKAFNCNTLLTFSALPKVKLNAMLLLYCLWCQYYACWTNKHNPSKMVLIKSFPTLMLPFSEEQKTSISLLTDSKNSANFNTTSLFFVAWLIKIRIFGSPLKIVSAYWYCQKALNYLLLNQLFFF